jgi:hypothetical protein
VTDEIVGELERGRVLWVQPWGQAKARLNLPCNTVMRHRYSGINILILWSAVIERGFGCQNWLTFRQALNLGGHIRKGDRGTAISYADRCHGTDRTSCARGISAAAHFHPSVPVSWSCSDELPPKAPAVSLRIFLRYAATATGPTLCPRLTIASTAFSRSLDREAATPTFLVRFVGSAFLGRRRGVAPRKRRFPATQG